ncbi:MAG: glycosyltransferase [Acidimicrobiales bacterium]|nr:glycosyltransferase [Acidimicrobiales bacterium]
MDTPTRLLADQLRRFVAVGTVATAVDIGSYYVLRDLGWTVLGADVVALSAAAAVSFGLHRAVTLRPGPTQRWLGRAGVFSVVVVVSGATDLAVLLLAGGSVADKVLAVFVAAGVRSVAHRTLMFRVIHDEQSHPANRPMPAEGPRLSVIVPAYQEVDRIATTVHRLRSELADLALPHQTKPDPGVPDPANSGLAASDLEIVVVDDGSADGTAAAARSAGADLVIEFPENRGKGAAVRAGMLEAHGRARAFLDADLAYGPDQLRRLLAGIEDGWDVVVGNRHHVATRTLAPTSWIRGIGSRVVNLASQVLLLGHYRDTQCGLKAFRGDVAEAIFPIGSIDGFAFDIELLHLVERYRLSLTEVPVEVENSERSTVKLVRDTWRLGSDILTIRHRSRGGGYPPIESLESLTSQA